MQPIPVRRNVLWFAFTVASGFSLFSAYAILEGAGVLYLLFLLPAAYLVTVIMVVLLVGGSDKPLLLGTTILLGAGAIVAATSLLAPNHGYPVAYSLYSTSCVQVKIANATSPWGYTYGSSCRTSLASLPASFVSNFLYWLPISGLVVYSLPSSRVKRSPTDKAAFAILGGVMIVALMLPLTGLLATPGL